MSARVLALSTALVVLGCGGSSSETPPPLEPNPMSARYTGPRLAPPDETPAHEVTPEPREEESEQAPSRPARATWGGGKTPSAAPKPAPTMTSPNALPPSNSPPPSATGAPASAF